MKKAFVSFLIVSFMFAVSACSNPRNAAIGVAGGVIGGALLLTGYSTSQREETNRLSIKEEHLTQREQIRASTVLSAPTALGGKGKASYESPEGTAKINADSQLASASAQPIPAPRQYQPAPSRHGNIGSWCQGLPPAAFERCMAPLR